MLQQILRDMWVDPELLAELDEDQKQTLFCRMREEQVRRWRAWDEDLRSIEEIKSIRKPPTKPGRKQVQFLMGGDGEPWVWVMGEHPNDKTIEKILEEEAREKARRQAEKEAEEFRKNIEAELTELLDFNQKQIKAMEEEQQKEDKLKDDSLDLYCSVEELREKVRKPVPVKIISIQDNKRDALQEICLNKPHGVSQRVAQWEKRVTEQRTSEIFEKIQNKQKEVAREAAEAERHQEQLWLEQERKAKQAEQQIREIARRAREEHRRTSILEMDGMQLNNRSSIGSFDNSLTESRSPMQSSPTGDLLHNHENESSDSKPPNKEAVIEWFRTNEVSRKAGIDPNTQQVSPWFHGLITRQEAESLLSEKAVGTFLIRVSERIWGYTITYKEDGRCKHYLIDASNGHYQFLGTNQLSHNTLGDLVLYHGKLPITVIGGELLRYPCPRDGLPAIFQGVLGIKV